MGMALKLVENKILYNRPQNFIINFIIKAADASFDVVVPFVC